MGDQTSLMPGPCAVQTWREQRLRWPPAGLAGLAGQEWNEEIISPVQAVFLGQNCPAQNTVKPRAWHRVRVRSTLAVLCGLLTTLLRVCALSPAFVWEPLKQGPSQATSPQSQHRMGKGLQDGRVKRVLKGTSGGPRDCL